MKSLKSKKLQTQKALLGAMIAIGIGAPTLVFAAKVDCQAAYEKCMASPFFWQGACERLKAACDAREK